MKPSSHFSHSAYKKIALFRSFFSGLPHAYGFRDPKSERQFQVKRPVTDQVLFDIIEINELETPSPPPPIDQPNPIPISNLFGLPPCALKMLREVVDRFQRVNCFRLAVHLKRIGLSCDMAQAVLKLWAEKNRPTDPKGRITEKEILAQTVYAFSRPYRGYSCRSEAVLPYCNTSCQVRKSQNPSLSPTG